MDPDYICTARQSPSPSSSAVAGSETQQAVRGSVRTTTWLLLYLGGSLKRELQDSLKSLWGWYKAGLELIPIRTVCLFLKLGDPCHGYLQNQSSLIWGLQ